MDDALFKLAVVRSTALHEFYTAERLAGADVLTANERTHEHAKYMDANGADLETIKQCIRRTS